MICENCAKCGKCEYVPYEIECDENYEEKEVSQNEQEKK